MLPLQHQEFLAAPNTDPRKELLEKLISEIPDNACVLAYHKSFEIGRLKDLGGVVSGAQGENRNHHQ